MTMIAPLCRNWKPAVMLYSLNARSSSKSYATRSFCSERLQPSALMTTPSSMGLAQNTCNWPTKSAGELKRSAEEWWSKSGRCMSIIVGRWRRTTYAANRSWRSRSEPLCSS